MAVTAIELLRNDYVVVTLECDGRIVRFRRTAQVFPSLSIAKDIYAGGRATYDRIGKTGRGLLIDSRDAIGRNDPEFEVVLGEFRSRSLPGFTDNVVLIRTAVGALQVQRHSRNTGHQRMITADERSAIEYLLARSPGFQKS